MLPPLMAAAGDCCHGGACAPSPIIIMVVSFLGTSVGDGSFCFVGLWLRSRALVEAFFGFGELRRGTRREGEAGL
jgi:hypothetical protein